MPKTSWRKRCLDELGEVMSLPRCAKGDGRTGDYGGKGSARNKVYGLLGLVMERSAVLREEAIAMIPGERLKRALRASGVCGISEIVLCLPALYEAVGRLAILTRALDRLRDELVSCNVAEWVGFQIEFCFDENVRPISEKVSKREFQKEAKEAHEERFSKRLGDFKQFTAAILNLESLHDGENGRILEGLLLSLRELNRDIRIHLTVIWEWQKRCEAHRASIRSIFRSVPPPVTGDGLTEKTPWEFPLSRMQGEGVEMAHEFMAWKGPEYSLNKQVLLHTDDENELLEYWDTDAGRFWFRYRMDPRISGSTG